MDIETQGLGAGRYPTPPEERTKERNITIYVEYSAEIEIPEDWDNEQIKDYISEERRYIIAEAEIENWEVEL